MTRTQSYIDDATIDQRDHDDDDEERGASQIRCRLECDSVDVRQNGSRSNGNAYEGGCDKRKGNV